MHISLIIYTARKFRSMFGERDIQMVRREIGIARCIRMDMSDSFWTLNRHSQFSASVSRQNGSRLGVLTQRRERKVLLVHDGTL